MPTGRMTWSVGKSAFIPKVASTPAKLSAKKLKYLKIPMTPKFIAMLKARNHFLSFGFSSESRRSAHQ